MRRTWPILLPTIVLALAGAFLSWNLLVKHEVKRTGLAWFDAVCEADRGAVDDSRSCDEVAASKWGTIPPIPEGSSNRSTDQMVIVFNRLAVKPRPVGLFGWMYFSALAAWYIAIGRPSYDRRRWHLAPLAFNSIGVLGSLFFTYVMFFSDLKAWCPWCAVVHGINALLLVGGVLLWPRKPRAVPHVADVERSESAGELQDVPHPPAAALPHPTLRLALVTLAGVVAVMTAEWWFHEYASMFRGRLIAEAQYADARREINMVVSHPDTLYEIYSVAEHHDIPITADDPAINAGPNRLQLVVFSDFQCPHCAGFARYLRKTIEPIFGNRLTIVFKHYPVDSACNPYVHKAFHSAACEAADAAEAARILGGDAAFWRAHDWLFAHRQDLNDRDTYPRLAAELKIDPAEFLDTMASDAVEARIVADIELGRKVDVLGTPTAYLANRRVPSLCREQRAFWEEVERRYDQTLAMQQGAQRPATQPVDSEQDQ